MNHSSSHLTIPRGRAHSLAFSTLGAFWRHTLTLTRTHPHTLTDSWEPSVLPPQDWGERGRGNTVCDQPTRSGPGPLPQGCTEQREGGGACHAAHARLTVCVSVVLQLSGVDRCQGHQADGLRTLLSRTRGSARITEPASHLESSVATLSAPWPMCREQNASLLASLNQGSREEEKSISMATHPIPGVPERPYSRCASPTATVRSSPTQPSTRPSSAASGPTCCWVDARRGSRTRRPSWNGTRGMQRHHSWDSGSGCTRSMASCRR